MAFACDSLIIVNWTAVLIWTQWPSLLLPFLFTGKPWPRSCLQKAPIGSGLFSWVCWSELALGTPEAWLAIREEGLCTVASYRIRSHCNLTQARGGILGGRKLLFVRCWRKTSWKLDFLWRELVVYGCSFITKNMHTFSMSIWFSVSALIKHWQIQSALWQITLASS